MDMVASDTKPAAILRGHEAPVACVQFVRDARIETVVPLLLSGDESGALYLWDLRTEEGERIGDSVSSAVLSLAQRNDTVYAQYKSGSLRALDVGRWTSTEVSEASGSSASLCRMALHGSHGVLFPCSDAAGAELRDMRGSSLVFERESSCGMLTALDACDGGFLSAYEDGSVARWDVRSERKPVVTKRVGDDALFCMRVAPRGGVAVVAGAPSSIYAVELDELRTLRTRKLGRRGVSELGWSTDGRVVASAGWDNRVRLWSGKRSRGSLLRRLCTLHWHAGTVRCVGMSNDGTQFASGSEDRTVAVWKVPR